MSFYYLFIFILGVIYLINSDYQIYNKAMSENLEDLVIELGENWHKKARVNDETILCKLFKFDEEPVQMRGGFSKEDLAKP